MGDIARTYWYMRDTYDIPISRQHQHLLEAWNRIVAINDREREDNRRIASSIKMTGNSHGRSLVMENNNLEGFAKSLTLSYLLSNVIFHHVGASTFVVVKKIR